MRHDRRELDRSWSEPSCTTRHPKHREREALRKTGAVQVSWEREQLIGGKPTRLVSRVLRVPVWVSD